MDKKTLHVAIIHMQLSNTIYIVVNGKQWFEETSLVITAQQKSIRMCMATML